MGRKLDAPIAAGSLASLLDAEIYGDAGLHIRGVASLESATDGDLCFFADRKLLGAAAESRASVIICRLEDKDAIPQASTKLVHKSPHAAFAKALAYFFPAPTVVAGISNLAEVHSSAVVEGVQVNAFSRIERATRIGTGSLVGSHVSIGADVVIGRDCVIHPNVTIYSGVRLGDRCIVHSGAVIGSDGFGFQPTAQGWLKVQQVGSVIIGDDVEIGANTSIDRGAIDDTVISNGVKIDNLVQIAHNCFIGSHTAIAACVGIAGSTHIGSRCMLGGAAMIVGHITICDDVIVSGGTVIAASIDAPGRYTGIFPSTEHRNWAKIAAHLRRDVNRKRSSP